MAGDARQMTPLRPAAVAIHDDGDVARQTARIELREQARLFAGRRFGEFRGFHLSSRKRFRRAKTGTFFTPQS